MRLAQLGAWGWQLGWADGSGGDVTALLRRHGVPEAVGLESGLLRRSAGADCTHDGFRNRVMVPTRDLVDGRILGFTGRRVGSDERAPKYLNSPTNAAYRKSSTLLGAWEARRALRDRGREIQALVVCEGPFDVIRVATTRLWVAVAPCGTALTPEQANWLVALSRAHDLPMQLAYDGDPAGQAATWRAWELLVDAGASSLLLADVPAGQDPGDLSPADLHAVLHHSAHARGLGSPRPL
jgi:DNA primase